MRWEHLFADLEAQADAAQLASFDAQVRDRTRAERASVELASRLLHARDTTVSVTTHDGVTTRGSVADAAAGWVLIVESATQTLVPLTAVAFLTGLGPRVADVTEVERRLSLGHALRALARDRTRVVIATQAGDVTGVIGVVGADYLEVSTGVGSSTVVVTSAIMRVRSAAA